MRHPDFRGEQLKGCHQHLAATGEETPEEDTFRVGHAELEVSLTHADGDVKGNSL